MSTYSRISAAHAAKMLKRASRRLAHEFPERYQAHYTAARSDRGSKADGAVRQRAWTRLRHEFPDRYQELLQEEHEAYDRNGDPEVDPRVRSAAWSRANAMLARLHREQYLQLFREAQRTGMPPNSAYSTAVTHLRHAYQGQFEELVAALQESLDPQAELDGLPRHGVDIDWGDPRDVLGALDGRCTAETLRRLAELIIERSR